MNIISTIIRYSIKTRKQLLLLLLLLVQVTVFASDLNGASGTKPSKYDYLLKINSSAIAVVDSNVVVSLQMTALQDVPTAQSVILSPELIDTTTNRQVDFPLIFIKGTYQAGLMVNPLYVVNFFLSGIPLGYIITWVYLVSDRSILACIVFHLFVNFMQEKIAMTPETKCVETLVVTVATVIIVAANKDMFFETRHVGRLLESVSEEGKKWNCAE